MSGLAATAYEMGGILIARGLELPIKLRSYVVSKIGKGERVEEGEGDVGRRAPASGAQQRWWRVTCCALL